MSAATPARDRRLPLRQTGTLLVRGDTFFFFEAAGAALVGMAVQCSHVAALQQQQRREATRQPPDGPKGRSSRRRCRDPSASSLGQRAQG